MIQKNKLILKQKIHSEWYDYLKYIDILENSTQTFEYTILNKPW